MFHTRPDKKKRMPAVASIHIQPEGQGGEATAIIHIGKNYKPPLSAPALHGA